MSNNLVKCETNNMSGNAQKRQNNDRGGPPAKRGNSLPMDKDSVAIKILIPASAVGAIIGKGGETMRNLKNDSGCRVHMSKNQEVYHGTNERICLVKGKIDASMKVMNVIIDKIKEKADANAPSDNYDLKGVERGKMMKLLVPNTSAGMVIGKSGSNIKEIRDNTGANIQVYPKAGSAEAKTSTERVVTIGHDNRDVLLDAVKRVLEKVAQDPLHDQPFDGKDVTDNNGSFTQVPTQNFSNNQSYSNPNMNNWQGNKDGSQFPNNQQKFNPMNGLGNMEVINFLEGLQCTLRGHGFNEAAVAEIMSAMQVLTKYNIMGLGLGLGVASIGIMRSNEQQQNMQNVTPNMMGQPMPMQQPGYNMPQGGMMPNGPNINQAPGNSVSFHKRLDNRFNSY
uniref:KH domain-containing protein n=1 Tax=Parastrongyloides trichosuri TaxID=131310 RepID=A0A0N4Z175_PARTI